MSRTVNYPYRFGQTLVVKEDIEYEQGPYGRTFTLKKGSRVQFDGMRDEYVAATQVETLSGMFVFLIPADKVEAWSVV